MIGDGGITGGADCILQVLSFPEEFQDLAVDLDADEQAPSTPRVHRGDGQKLAGYGGLMVAVVTAVAGFRRSAVVAISRGRWLRCASKKPLRDAALKLEHLVRPGDEFLLRELAAEWAGKLNRERINPPIGAHTPLQDHGGAVVSAVVSGLRWGGGG